MSSSGEVVELRFLGKVGYGEALDLQRSLVEHATAPYVLVLEHTSVITIGRRGDVANILDARDVPIVETDRGGDVTWHGPGQVVCYPIVDLGEDPGAAKAHVCKLENALATVVRRVADPAVVGEVGRLEGHPGIWVNLETDAPRKVGAIGVRSVRNAKGIRRSMHGVSLNVDCDLQAFRSIVPCGLSRPVTSLSDLGVTMAIREVAELVGHEVAQHLRPGSPVRSVQVMTGLTGIEGAQPVSLKRLAQAGVDATTSLSISQRKPEWLRSMVRLSDAVSTTRSAVASNRLVTVCEEAGCPNLSECWSDGTATFMVNGADCTRRCGFCLIGTAKPEALDADEPRRVAQAVAELGLAHAVVTCVARDDLADGGASGVANTILAIRTTSPDTQVEVLISDCKGDGPSLDVIFTERPDVLNHNIETVARLQRAVRPSAGYARSLGVLARAGQQGLVTKSGLMVGLGETMDEVAETLSDLAAVGVKIVTVGQYLRPTAAHLPVARYYEPQEFVEIAEIGRRLGLSHVESSPLTRSSYHAKRAASGVAEPTTLKVSLSLKESR
jgi:lipoic acid synthetase